ncbi:MAG: 50S ribosomal protein L11 [bacterium]|nr:50S ribosomal protein L11 [bacterium]
MAKKVLAVVKVNIEAGKANPAPPVGTALGPHGIAIMDFCRQYNDRTADRAGQIVPAEITIYEDRSFGFILKTPPTSFLVREAAGVDKGASEVGREFVGAITDAQLASIAEIKLPDLNTDDIDMAKRQVAGTARSMGVRVVRG